MTKARKLDTEEIRAAANGRWIEILTTVAGIPAELLDPSKEHPCPLCGGATRFRLVDESMGAVLCSHCFSKKNGDGFAAVKWAKGCTFPEAKKLIAQYLGMTSTASGAKVDPAKDLKWRPWNTNQALIYLSKKPGCTEAAMQANGAQQAMYKDRYMVFAWPIYGPDLDTSKPVGWVMANYTGDMLPVWNKEGAIVGKKKYKLTYGSQPGIVGRHAVERLKTAGLVDVVWKVEGISDLDAMWALIPENLRDRHVAVTTANGAAETPRWQAGWLSNADVNIVHDADKPGQSKVNEWADMITTQGDGAKLCRNVLLPYEIQEVHGKDLRDYINEPRTYDDLLALADQTTPFAVARTETGEVDLTKSGNAANDNILKKLQLEVLYEEEGGRIRVFSTLLRKSSSIPRVAMMKAEDLNQYAGVLAVNHVVVSANDATEDQFTLGQVRRALSVTASGLRARADEKGIGVWQAADDLRNHIDEVVLVNSNEGAVWTSDLQFKRIVTPRYKGIRMDLGAGYQNWYDFDVLAKYIEMAADPQWRAAVVLEMNALFAEWQWRTKVSPMIVTGLVLASWTQTLFQYRPLVSISGVTNSGKSYVFTTIGGNPDRLGMFGWLGFRQSDSTCAGILQGLARNGRVVMCDEFEASVERRKLMDAFRRSTGSDGRALGSASQKHVEQQLRHLCWVAATETGIEQEADMNRFIQLDLIRPETKDHGGLVLRDIQYLLDLGQRSLAVAVRGGLAAKEMATRIKKTSVPGIDARTVESYGVVASVLSVADGGADDEQARKLLLMLLGNVERADQNKSDQDELLNEILTASLFVDAKLGTKTIAQVLPLTVSTPAYKERVEAVGVKLLEDYSIFIYPPLAKKHLLKDTPRAKQRIDQILIRIAGASRHALRIGGRAVRGIIIPNSAVDLFDEVPVQTTQVNEEVP